MLAVFGPDGTPLGTADRRRYHAACMSSTHYSIDVRLLDRDRRIVATTPSVVDGERTIDCTADVTSSATATVIDRRRRLLLGSDALFLDRILQVIHKILVPDIGWCRCHLFTGPCSAPTVTGNEITFEAQGMELWAMGSVTNPRHYPKGALVSEVIRDIMLTGVGEVRGHLKIPRRTERLPEGGFTVTLADTWWGAARALAQSINCDLFYNMSSSCVLRGRPTQIVWVWTGYSLVSVPTLSSQIGAMSGTDVSAIRNRFVVVGQGKPDGDGDDPPAVIGIWDVPAGNRYAASSLGHPNKALRLKDVVQLPHVRLARTANQIARNRGRRTLQLAQAAEINTRLLPDIEQYDRFRIRLENTPPGPFEHLQSGTPWFPTPDNPQTWGSTRRVAA